ncbi:MAG: tetratricopeptide repeat protein [Gemmatimonadota bacterium]|nr:tetratricopeptide repeat protein [Gemmatimonadota bacterium]
MSELAERFGPYRILRTLGEGGMGVVYEAAYREALDIGLETLGADHDVVTSTMNNLGLLLSNTGRYVESQTWLRRALATDEQKLGRDNPAVAIDLLNLAFAICRGGATDEGAAVAARAAEIFARTEPGSWAQGAARVARGACLTDLGRFDEAERELRAGTRILERVLGPTHRRVDSARARMAELDQARAAVRRRPQKDASG